MTQPKVSHDLQWHTLSCPTLSTISIYDAWEYLDDCKYYITNKELLELKDLCNFKSRCRCEISRTKHHCHRWYPAWTKSKIRYYCVYHNDDQSTTPVTVSSNKAVKFTTSEIAGKTNAGVIAGSVFGVLGILALLLLLLYCIWKRRKAIKQNDTSTRNTTHAVGQNSNILYVVPENLSPHTHDPPPAYSTLYPKPNQDHVCINNEAITSQNLERQQENDYNHTLSAHINNSIPNDDYNHTDTGVNLSGRPGED